MKSAQFKNLLSAVAGCILGVILVVSYNQLQRYHVRSSMTSALLPETHNLYTYRHYLQSGYSVVTSFLESYVGSHGSSITNTLRNCYPACVRIEHRYNHVSKDRYTASCGSGVIVSGGKFLLTAGHMFDDAKNDPDSVTKIAVVTGELFDANMFHLEYDFSEKIDLAVLRIDAMSIPMPLIEMAEAEVGQTVFIIGYPDAMGIDANGNVQKSTKQTRNYLKPLTLVGRIKSVSKHIEIVPTVGCMPLSGLSGAPVFNEMGALVGIQNSVAHYTRLEESEDLIFATPLITGRKDTISSLISDEK